MNHQFIKKLKLSETILSEEHPYPYTPVNFQFHWEPAVNLLPRSQEEIDADHKELGRQLMKAIWDEKKKHD